MYKRNETRSVFVRDIEIGNNNSVVIQSMITHLPRNVEKCVEAINQLDDVGCQIVRMAVLTIEDAKAISEIKAQTSLPIVADIHFDYKLALAAIDAGVDKVRINPGNIGSIEKVQAVVEKCQAHRIPIRIGVNSGSMPKDLKEQYGSHSAIGLVESAKRHVKILEDLDFYDIIISLKASNVITTIETYKLAAKEFSYPLHLGVTEAGTDFSGTIKSSVALGTLLYEGIGSTIRVSLSALPVEEIKVAKEILSSLDLYRKPNLVSCPTCGRCEIDLIHIAKKVEEHLHNIDKNITVAVMGCVVNGPGEASDADIGIAGGGKNAILFKKGKKIRTIDSKDILQELIAEIELMDNE